MAKRYAISLAVDFHRGLSFASFTRCERCCALARRITSNALMKQSEDTRRFNYSGTSRCVREPGRNYSVEDNEGSIRESHSDFYDTWNYAARAAHVGRCCVARSKLKSSGPSTHWDRHKRHNADARKYLYAASAFARRQVTILEIINAWRLTKPRNK